MTTIGSAEPLPALQRQSADDDKQLMQQAKSSGTTSQPQLRIVHSAGRVQAPLPGNMPPRDRTFQATESPSAMLDRTVQAQIGRLLRDAFAGVADEPVPDRFIALLAELESKSKSKSKEKTG